MITVDVENDLDRLFDPIRFDSLLSLVRTYGEEATLEALIVSASSLETDEERRGRAGLLVWFFGWTVLEPLAKKRKENPLPLQGRFAYMFPKWLADDAAAYGKMVRLMCEAILDAIQAEILRD